MRSILFRLFVLIVVTSWPARGFAQDVNAEDTTSHFSDDMRIGICMKKFYGFYLSSGVTVFADESTFGIPLATGVHLTSSYLGSATFSQALPLFMTELFANYRFRSGKALQPFAGILIGGAFTNYKDPVFKYLPQAQTLFAPELGIACNFKSPLQVSASFGYYLTTGNGKRGLGLVYPLFGQLGITYNLK
jgi:hypothetical protein